MRVNHLQTPTSDEGTLADQIASICRTTVGDGLRSVILFAAEDHEVISMRSDLRELGDRVRTIEAEFVENERLGFDSRETYERLLVEPQTEPDIGDYEFTIRVFSAGFVSRVLVGDRGIRLTTDDIDIEAFEDMAVALRGLLAAQ